MTTTPAGYRIPNDPDCTEGFCKDCRCWYHETEKVEQKHIEGPGEPVTLITSFALALSECRRYPPYTTHPEVVHPAVDPMHWCGEFRS
jgi:hypothetical protein